MPSELHKSVLDRVSQHHPGETFAVVEEIAINNGAILLLECNRTHSHIFITLDNGATHEHGSPAECIRYLVSITSPINASFWRTQLAKISGASIASILVAIAITGTICYVTIVKQSEEMVTVLCNSLTLIVGFYFGRHIATAKDAKHEPKSTDSQVPEHR